MKCRCKFCAFSTNGQGRILQHYKEHHGHYHRCSGLICIYKDCLKTFQTQVEIKNHLKEHVKEAHKIVTKLSCNLYTFSESSDISKYLAHLKTHLKNRQVVKCPFADCFFRSSALSTFTAHRGCNHKSSSLENFSPGLLAQCTLSVPVVEEDFVLDTEDLLASDSISEAGPEFENGKAIQNHL